MGSPAWHYADEDGLVPDKYQTCSAWRGYQGVRVTEGDPGQQTRRETVYFRGMNGDKLPTGTRTATVPASEGAAVADENAFAGMAREELTYNGPGGAVVSATISDAWQSAATASRTIDGVTVSSRFTGVSAERERTALDGGRGWRRTTLNRTFDSFGMAVREENLGDDAVAGDEQCTLTTSARNTTAWLMEFPSREQEFGVDCAKATGTGLTEADAISDTYTSYDQQARGAAPTKGAESRTEKLKAWPGTYLTTERAEHDANGRVIRSRDVRGSPTSTAFTQAGGTGPATGTTVTNVLSWQAATAIDPAWGLPLSTTGNPSVNFFMPLPDNTLKLPTQILYDGASRPTAELTISGGVEKWRTTTAYGGDRTDVTPPAGAPPKSTTIDAYDRIATLREAGQTTSYRYDRKGQLATMTNPAGTQWNYAYDPLGRKTIVDDPDQGTTTTAYNDAGDPVSVTDARGEVLAAEYDALGRRTALRGTR